MENIVEILNPTNLLVVMPFIIIAVIQFLKKMGLSDRFAPVVNVVLGFMAMPIFLELGIAWYYSIMGCLILGLSAGGFYDFGNKTIKGN